MISGKSVLIFGAGINQLELIREAKSLGVISVVIDPQPDPPGRQEAEFFYRVGGEDYDATRAVAVKHGVSGMVTGQTEKPLRMMARLAEELGLIFHSPEVTERCLDKWLMKSAFRSHRIPCADGILIRHRDQLNEDLSGFSYPVIMKPVDSFSSRGVVRIDSQEELKTFFEESRNYSTHGDVIIEEFLAGKEYSAEAVTYRGKTFVVQITEKFITPYPHTVETGHLQPADLSESVKAEMISLVQKAIASLGIDNSASHTEVMVTAEGPKVIEVGARLGGDFISSYLTKASTGVSMDRAAVQVALGGEPDLKPSRKDYAMIRYIELPVGRKVTGVQQIDDIRQLPGVEFAWVFVRPGDTVLRLTHSGVRPACILVKALSREKLLRDTAKYCSLLSDKILLI